MKKLFLAGIGILLTFSLVFLACSEPTEFTLNPGRLPEFRFETRVAEGGVLLSWEPVADAAGYEVWRQQTSNGQLESVRITVSDKSETSYADVKCHGNNLAVDVTYKYTVVALSRYPALAYSVYNEYQNSVETGAALLSSAQSRDVRFRAADLPDSISLNAVSALNLRLDKNYNILASWEADANPLVKYEVSFNNGGNIISHYSKNFDTISSQDNVVDVTVRKIIGDGNFYAPSAAKTESITVFRTNDSYTASDLFCAIRNENLNINIIFPVYDGIALENYKLQRIKLNAAGTQAAGARWESVSLAGAYISQYQNNGVYKAFDVVEVNSYYKYRLVVKYPNTDNIHAILIASLDTITNAGELTAPNVEEVIKNDLYDDYADDTIDDLEPFYYFRYNIEHDADYTLYRKQASGQNGAALPGNIKHDWVKVNIHDDDRKTTLTSETIKFTVPDGMARTKFDYKIVATGKGSKTGYRSAETTGNITGLQFSPSITPKNIPVNTPAEWYEIQQDRGVEFIGTRQNQAGTDTYEVFKLELDGLSSVGGIPLLREDEELTVEFIAHNGAPYTAPVKVTRSTTWYGPQGLNAITVPTADYYFAQPIPSDGGYYMRLHISAK